MLKVAIRLDILPQLSVFIAKRTSGKLREVRIFRSKIIISSSRLNLIGYRRIGFSISSNWRQKLEPL